MSIITHQLCCRQLYRTHIGKGSCDVMRWDVWESPRDHAKWSAYNDLMGGWIDGLDALSNPPIGPCTLRSEQQGESIVMSVLIRGKNTNKLTHTSPNSAPPFLHWQAPFFSSFYLSLNWNRNNWINLELESNRVYYSMILNQIEIRFLVIRRITPS